MIYKKLTILLLSVLLVSLAVGTVSLVPIFANSTQEVLIGSQVPSNSSNTLGVQEFVSPPVSRNLTVPNFSARSVLIKDLNSDTILFQKNAEIELPIASTTKIMTALVASEHFDQNTPLTVGYSSGIDGSNVGLQYGEVLTFRSLLYGMLLNSGNDAAFAIAENYPGGVASFVAAMNNKALDLGLLNTHFDNPAGFDSPNHYSSALDLAKMTEQALKDPTLARIFATKETEIISLDKTRKHQLSNLNQLLSTTLGMIGVKTGYTKAAKENLVGLVDRDNHLILTIVLGSDDRFGESSQLIEWVYKNYQWR